MLSSKIRTLSTVILGVAALTSCLLAENTKIAIPSDPAIHGAFSLKAPIDTTKTRQISAKNPDFRYNGRIDFKNPRKPVIIWQATTISVDFSGNILGIDLSREKNQCFFNVVVDGKTYFLDARKAKNGTCWLSRDLATGRHHLKLFKRSEATAGYVSFDGIRIEKNARVWAPPKTKKALAVEFIGDSITVGACNEDGPFDQWTDRSTHDNALSYGADVARDLSADYRNIAVSGMGVVIGWVPMEAGQIWDRLYPKVDSPRANLKAWTPNVVFVNIGENDFSYTSQHGMPFPANFAGAYMALIKAIRKAYPKTEIVLLRGGMFGGANSPDLKTAWKAAARTLEFTDPHISDFSFKHWTNNHPRVKDDCIMANELVSWLKKQPFMWRYLDQGSLPAISHSKS